MRSSAMRALHGPLSGAAEISAVSEAYRSEGWWNRLVAAMAGFNAEPSLHPAKNAEDLYVSSSVVAPAPGGQVVLLSYQVPIGHCFALTGIMFVFDANAALYVPGDGSITWSVDVNRPLVASVLAISGRPLAGLSAELVPLGSHRKPYVFPRPRIFQASDLLQLKVLTTNTIPQNSGFFNSRFVGYLWPAE